MATQEGIEYVGEELELFKHAKNWKTYFSGKLAKYISGDVLEVGAGLGINATYFAKQSAGIQSYTCLEPDEKLASQIEDNLKEITIRSKRIIHGTIRNVENQRFDTIIYIDVLEHIKKSDAEIVAAKELLKPNGHLIILVPAYQFLFNEFDKSIGHFRRYNKKVLLKEVNNGLSTLGLFYLDSVGFFASLVNKFILKKKLPSKGNIKMWDGFMIPASKFLDPLVNYRFGKSLIGIFQKKTSA